MHKKIIVTAFALMLTIFGAQQFSRAQNAAKAPQPQLKAADIDKMMTQLSNWGRWGKDDQRGALNLITPAKRKQAAALVREGISVSLAHDFSNGKAVDNTRPLEYTMTLNEPVAMEELRIFYHGLTYAHMDAMCHARYKGKAYNGFDASLATEAGCAKGGVEHLKDGILTRGILIDVPRLKGVPYLEGGTPVLASDVEAWEKKAGVKIGSGDVVLIRRDGGPSETRKVHSACRASLRACMCRCFRSLRLEMRPCWEPTSALTSPPPASTVWSFPRIAWRLSEWG